MKKRFGIISLLLSGVVIFTACGTENADDAKNTEPVESSSEKVEYDAAFLKATTDLNEYKKECDQKGEVVSLEYDTPAYAVNDIFGVDETVHKKLNIYLPYAYDETKQYNILYLLHGTKGETEVESQMEDYWLKSDPWGPMTCNVLDNMIKDGLCEPLIVVTPNYYSSVEGYEITESEVAEVATKLNDTILLDPQDIWPQYFQYELRENIIPTVESEYLTFANKDVTVESLQNSRDHRAFSGLSRGAMAVARSGLIGNTDLFSYYGSFSGVWTEFDQFKEALTTGENKDYEIKYWFNGNGKGDFALENHEEFKNQVLEEMPEEFVDGENFAYVIKRDGAHAYSSWVTDLYNSLLVFFK